MPALDAHHVNRPEQNVTSLVNIRQGATSKRTSSLYPADLVEAITQEEVLPTRRFGMAEGEETATQRAARLRREKRAAKIAATGTARLGKITGLSGRTMSFHEDSPSSRNTPSPPSGIRHASPPSQSTPQAQPPLGPSPSPMTPPNADSSLQTIKEQEEYIRALLRSQPPTSNAEDPTAKLLGNLLGMQPPNAGVSTPGGTVASPPGAGAPGLSPDEIASALGVPSSMASLFLQANSGPASPAAQRNDSIWRAVHIIFATLTSLYLLMLINSSISLYGGGDRLPPPATAQNPFTILVMGELLLTGTRVMFMKDDGNSGGNGVVTALKIGRRVLSDVVRDGKIMIFVLGIGSLWMKYWEEKIKTE